MVVVNLEVGVVFVGVVTPPPLILQMSAVIREHLLELVGDPMLSMLDLRDEDKEPGVDTVSMLVASAKFKNSPKVGVACDL